MKRSLLAITSILFCLGHASSTWAATPPPKSTCIDSQPTFKAILDHFSWRSNDPQFKPDLCDPKNLAYRLAESVLNLAAIDNLYSKSTHSPSQGVLSSGPFHFFSNRIQAFVFEPNEGMCAGLAVAYVNDIGNGNGNGIMHICKRLANTDDLTITSTLVHEARHQDPSGYEHTTCRHGIYAGYSQTDACDASFSNEGSYGVEVEYLIQVSHLEKLDPSVRQFARAQAIQLLVERFNTLPMGIEEGAVLASDNSKLSFYNGETAIPLHPLTDPKTRLIKQNGVLNFYDSAKNTISALADGINLNPNPAPLNSKFRNLIDVYEHAQAMCFLFANQVTCDFPNSKVTLPIKDFTPVGFWTYDALNRSNPTIYIASKEQRVYAFTENSKTFTSDPTYFKSVSSWNKNYFIGLGFKGEVLFVDKNPNSAQPYGYGSGLNPNDKFTQMITPYFWSKELQAL